MQGEKAPRRLSMAWQQWNVCRSDASTYQHQDCEWRHTAQIDLVQPQHGAGC